MNVGFFCDDSRERDEDDPDIRDLELSLGALEERVLEQYTHAKVQYIVHL